LSDSYLNAKLTLPRGEVNMRKIFPTLTCLFLLFLVPVYAQTSNGTYTTYTGDRLAVTENYRIIANPDGSWRTEAEIVPPSRRGATQKIVTVASKTHPVSFTVEVGGAKVTEAKFSKDVVVLKRAGLPEREVQTKATMVLENLVWHQFLFLLGQYDHTKAGRQDFTAFLPAQGIEYPVSLEYISTSSYRLKDRTIATRRYRVVAAEHLTLELWADEAGVPLLFQVAAQQLKVIRQGAESLAESVFALPAAYQSPTYAVPAAFREQELIIGQGGEWPLPATLTMPAAGKGPFPAVVLVHGSGPNDRDETLGPNKPFRDLAWGLATQGIAVLRYEKRTREHAAKIAALPAFTVKKRRLMMRSPPSACSDKRRASTRKRFSCSATVSAACSCRASAQLIRKWRASSSWPERRARSKMNWCASMNTSSRSTAISTKRARTNRRGQTTGGADQRT
jgi:hypothetical protein